MPIRVLVVEDDDFTRSTLAGALQHHGLDVVATSGDAKGAMAAAATHRPDAVLLDLDLGPGPTGIDVAHALRRTDPAVGVVILTSFTDPRLLASSLADLPDGANYVVKQSLDSLDLLITAIEASLTRSTTTRPDTTVTGLTEAQIDTLRLLAAGMSNAQIASIRVVTEKTVEQSIARAAKRLDISATPDVNQRVALAREYFRLTGATRHARPRG